MNQTNPPIEFSALLNQLPASVAPILITLALSFLIGLEREEHATGQGYNFGGIRTFPIIGLCGYLMARLADGQAALLAVGIAVFGAFFWLSYRKKLELSSNCGMTSEVSGIFTFLLGALLYYHALWEATALAVSVLLLLELKVDLESLAKKLPSSDIFTFTRFLLITAVVLPIIPNREFTELHFNPFHMWLIVVVISSLSYGAYVVERLLGSKSSLVATAVLGGIYSSTSTTVVLAKRSVAEKSNRAFSGAILLASGLMYFRLLVLIGIFNDELFRTLMVPFLVLGLLASILGVTWMTLVGSSSEPSTSTKMGTRNPLELQSALIFAALFSIMGILTSLTLQYLGTKGMFGLSFFTGLTDVDPFVMSLTQSAGTVVATSLAAKGIVIASASNNMMKGIYAAIGGAESVRKQGSWALAGLGLVSLASLFIL